MLQAGLKKLQILEEQFAEVDPNKHPKLLVVLTARGGTITYMQEPNSLAVFIHIELGS